MVPTLQARKQQLVRDAIWDAAIDLFAQKGFDETTVDDIAERAGVSRRSFFRYFSSKSDLMAQGIVSYGTALTDAIEACPPSYSLSEVMQRTALELARQSQAYPRTRKIMEIAAKHPAAREAQLSRLAEVQDGVVEAFARRCGKGAKDTLLPNALAGLTMCILSVTFRYWFDDGKQDIPATVQQVITTLSRLLCDGSQSKGKNTRARQRK